MEARAWHRHYDYNVPTTIRYPRLALHELLGIPANAYPDKPALIFYGTEMSFWELRELVLRMANALGRLGVKKGDRVGMHLPNCPQYLIANYAALSLGAIVVNLNPMYTPDELKLMTGKTGVTTLFTFDMVLQNIRALCKSVEIPRVIVTKVTDFIKGMGKSTKESLELDPKWHHFSELLESCTDTRRPRVQVNPEDPGMIQFTGGTTGVPKGAVLTHANLVAATFQCALWGSPTIQYTPPERRNVLALLPFFHVYGNIVVMNWALFNCATQILVPRFQIDELMGLLANFQEITFFPAVPTMINALVNHPKAGELNLARKAQASKFRGSPHARGVDRAGKRHGHIFQRGLGNERDHFFRYFQPYTGPQEAGQYRDPIPGYGREDRGCGRGQGGCACGAAW
jgi:long-chain acyl-CoA synthetase